MIKLGYSFPSHIHSQLSSAIVTNLIFKILKGEMPQLTKPLFEYIVSSWFQLRLLATVQTKSQAKSTTKNTINVATKALNLNIHVRFDKGDMSENQTDVDMLSII